MPTEKQKRAARITLDNPRNPMGKNLKEAGYSRTTQIHPRDVTESKGWKEIMKEYFPDDYMAQKHRQLFEKEETIVKNNNKTGKIEVIKTGEIDANAVKSALDMGYKLTGKYAAEEHTIVTETLEQRIKRKNKQDAE